MSIFGSALMLRRCGVSATAPGGDSRRNSVDEPSQPWRGM